MRRNFALLSATVVVCLGTGPALASNDELGQSYKRAAQELTSNEQMVASIERAALALDEADEAAIQYTAALSASTTADALAAKANAKPDKKPQASADALPVIVKKKVAKKRTRERLVAKINLSSQTMNVTVDGKLKHSFKISSGAKGYHTPTGSYKPYYMTSMHYSKKYNNAPMPHSVFFRGGYAIHATGSVRRLGNPASHGCVRLSPGNARKFFKLVQKYRKAGTRIRISGSTPASRSFKKRYARRTVRKRRNSWSNFGRYGNNSVSYTVRRRPANVRRIRIGRPANQRRRRDSRILNWQY